MITSVVSHFWIFVWFITNIFCTWSALYIAQSGSDFFVQISGICWIRIRISKLHWEASFSLHFCLASVITPWNLRPPVSNEQDLLIAPICTLYSNYPYQEQPVTCYAVQSSCGWEVPAGTTNTLNVFQQVLQWKITCDKAIGLCNLLYYEKSKLPKNLKILAILGSPG